MRNKVSDVQKIIFFDNSWKHIQRILAIVQDRHPKSLRLGSSILEWVADHLEGWMDMEESK